MKKLKKVERKKRITDQQREVKCRKRTYQLMAREALGFNKMKIIGIKTHKI
jgi:hypothetical protein